MKQINERVWIDKISTKERKLVKPVKGRGIQYIKTKKTELFK